MVRYEKLTPPSSGGVIRFDNGQPVVPDNPIVPFIRGDGTGVDIWPATQRVIDAAAAGRCELLVTNHGMRKPEVVGIVSLEIDLRCHECRRAGPQR